LISLVRRLGASARSKAQTWEGTRIRAFKIQQQELLAAQDLVHILAGILGVLQGLIIVCLVYIYIQGVFSLYPATRGWAQSLLQYVLQVLSTVTWTIIDYLPNLFFIIVISIVANYIIKLARLIFNGINAGRIRLPGFYQDWAKPTFNIARFLIIVFAVIIIIPYLPGAGSRAFQGVSIFFGLLLSLGSTAAVANVVAGVVITYMRAFRIGDRVKIADTIGEVTEKTLFVTRVKTPKNVDVTIPNAMVLANHIINFSSLSEQQGLILHSRVTIGYDAPWPKVHELLLEAASCTEGIETQPEPFVLQVSLDDFYATYEVNAYTRSAGQMPEIYSALHQNIQNRFHQAGIEITSPHFSALRDGNRSTIPEDHLPRDYNPPAFRIHPLEKLVDLAKPKNKN
jgi:small-conductance mechanosensitive channel